MINQEKKSNNSLAKFLALLILLLLIGAAITFLTPIGKPLLFAYKTATSNSTYNFKGLTELDQPNTKTATLNTPCKVSTKYSDTIFKDPTVVQAPTNNTEGTATLKLLTKDDLGEFSISCNRVAAQVDAIKNYILTSWATKPELEQQFGVNLDQVKALSRVEFFKTFTSKTNPTCSIKDDLDKQTFLNPTLTSRFSKSYTYCQNKTSTQTIQDYYLFPTDESDVILVLRTINADKFKSDFLVF
jgi:hypothetical protein